MPYCAACAVLPGKRIGSALTIVFILKTKQILVMIAAAVARITADITGGSVRPVYAFACRAASSLGTNLLTQNIFLLPLTTTTSPLCSNAATSSSKQILNRQSAQSRFRSDRIGTGL